MTDREIVRELAKKYGEIAGSEKNKRMRQRFLDTNNLKLVRPPVNIEEVPWFEMNIDGELDLLCGDENYREMEKKLRIFLFREKHFSCDNYIEPFWNIKKNYEVNGIGFEVREERRSVDDKNWIVSHHYEDVLEDEKVLEKYEEPVVKALPEKDEKEKNFAEEALGDILPVRLTGNMTYYAPWDEIATLRGVEPILMDMYDRPEYVHRIIGLYTKRMKSIVAQMKAQNLFGPESLDIHCTPAAVDYPEDGRIHCWFRTMAQMFSTISPEMHYEFDMAYSIPLSEEFSYTYYGCCEPLSDRISELKNYKNLRKVGCSPWADVEKTAELLGKDYVLSRKPNPAFVAMKTDPEVVKKELIQTVEACEKYGTPFDYTLKDISTAGYRPENLILWAKTVSEVLDGYYGKA